MRLNKVSLWLCALLVLGGCGEPKLSAITVTCDPASVVAGQTSQCTASATDQDGKPFAVSGYTWSSSDEAVATVDSTGKATTLAARTTAPRTAVIRASATADGVTQQGQATLTVTPQPPQLSTVTVTCDRSSVPATRPAQCTASAKDQYGQPFTVPSYTWTSSNESVATVGSTGKITTLTTGAVTLRASATINGVTQQGQASLTVTEAQPTFHSTPITANESWSETDNPHVVQGSVDVSGASAPTLTISAGTVVRFASGAALLVGWTDLGGLIVDGTAAAPVLFTADSANPQPGSWKGVHVNYHSESPSRISHATIEYAGASNGSGSGVGNLNLYVSSFADPGTVLSNVVVRKSSQNGFHLLGSGFGPGSTGLAARDNGGYPIAVLANHVHTIPSDIAISGNGRDAVQIPTSNVTTNQTWPNLGIPYVINGWLDVGATLTLLPGTEIRFGPGTPDVGLSVGGQGVAGALLAEGTAQAPIRFVPDAATPTPGLWGGLHFRDSSGSKLNQVLVSHAGASVADTIGYTGTGNVNVYREIGGFLTNSTLRDSSNCGITRSPGGTPYTDNVTTDFTLATYNNTFANNTGGAQCAN